MNRFLEEILEQPAILRRIASAYAGPNRQVLEDAAACLRHVPVRRYAGMGSSQYVAAPAVATLNRAGLPSLLYDAAELYHYELPPGELRGQAGFCLSSHSGESVEIRLLAEALAGSPIVALTDHPASSLGRASRFVLPIWSGPQAAVGTKTNTALMAVHLFLAARILGQPLPLDAAQAVSRAVEAVLVAWEGGLLRPAVEYLGDPPFVSLLGRGPGLACAHLAAITLEEAAGLPCEAMSAALFRHGPMELAGEPYRFVLFSPPGKTQHLMWKLAQDLARFGARVLVLAGEVVDPSGRGASESLRAVARRAQPGLSVAEVPGPGGALGRILAVTVACPAPGEDWCTLPLLVVCQLLAYELARARGLEPGQLRKAAAVTLEE